MFYDQVKPGNYWKLAMLVVQNATLSLSMKASATKRSLGRPYSLSSAVFAAESIKFATCYVVLLHRKKNRDKSSWSHFKHVGHGIFSINGSVAFAIPAAIYVLQNLLQYIGSSFLDIASYQLFSQMKLFTAAVWGYVLLGRRPSSLQWLGLILAAVGVSVSQSSISGVTMYSLEDRLYGMLSMMAACTASGFAGVYTERLIKKVQGTLLICNAQMALYSLPVTLITAYVTDGARIRQDGLFHDFNSTIWFCILLQVVGGFLVSWCLKYTDTNAKNVAVSIAVIVAAVAATYFFDEPLTPKLFLGATLVVTSVWVFVHGSEQLSSNRREELSEDISKV